jgi:hypothetical protein
MASVPCTNCGAALTPGTKFCRKCGQPSLDAASVSEASTRIFEATAERAAPAQTWGAQPTGPAYIAPSGAGPIQDATTRSLEQDAGNTLKSKLFIPVLVLLLLMVTALAVGLLLMGRGATSTTTAPPQTPPVVTQPGTDLPPPPPPPVAPPFEEQPTAGPTVPSSQLKYPGAETVLDMKTGRENMLELRTDDAANKVIDWYVDKLKPTQTIRPQGGEAILRTGRTTVIISGRGEATDIIIRQGAEQ